MIRTERELAITQRRLAESDQAIEQQRQSLAAGGLSPEEIDRALEPMRAMRAQFDEEIAWYTRVRQGDIDAIEGLAGLGQLLIAARIASGLTQRALAERLGVDESQVSRDERNEYHGVTIERAQRILDSCEETVILHLHRRSAVA
jgi:hypothetical protein